MGSNLVIVAIPDEDDRVWKVSSEKVPHLTLLYLGDSDQVANVDKMVEFVEHAATTTLKRFYLPVDRRDTLGADEADVLFFKKGRYDFKAIRDFRAALLQDNNIRTAYDSASQFEGPWEPHLTLGYPATPANPMPDGWEGRFYSVEFTKIAVWVDNFDGPEFLLSDYWDDEEALAMGVMSPNQARIAMGMEALQHFGVKGMKWGVRKAKDTQVTVGGKTKMVTEKKATKLDKRFEKKVGSANTFVELHNGAADHVNAQLPAMNARFDKKYPKEIENGVFHNDSHPITKEYHKAYNDLFTEGLNRAAEKMGTNATGTRKVRIVTKDHESFDDFSWSWGTEKIKHAAEGVDLPDGDITFVATLDTEGRVIKTEPQVAVHADPAAEFLAHHGVKGMTQSAITAEEFVDTLMHFGIKGMKWGQRKARPAPTASAPVAVSRVPHGDKRKTKLKVEGGSNHPAHEDAIKVAEAKAKLQKSGVHALSNKELRDVRERIQLEEQVHGLMTSRGRKFVRNQLQNESQNLARAGARAGVKKGVKKAGPAVRRAAAVGATAALI